MATTKKRILIVDDDHEMAVILQKILIKDGYEAGVAHDGQEALDDLGANPTHLVITDLRMPNVDGMKLLRHIADKIPQVPVIIITGFGEVEEYLDAMNQGAFEFLPKPLDIKELKRQIERALA